MYQNSLNMFFKFHNITGRKLLDIPKDEIQVMVEDYVFSRKKMIAERWEWYYSPHFHILGFGWINDTAENYKKNGWLVKNLGQRDSTFATFWYQLSHAGIKSHNHALTWFGDLSYSKLKVPDNEEDEDLCPYCNEKIRELFCLDNYWKPPDIECELAVNISHWTYGESVLQVQGTNYVFNKMSNILQKLNKLRRNQIIVGIVSILIIVAVLVNMEIDEQNKLDKIGECRAIISEHLDNPCVDNDQCEKRQEAEEQKCFNEFDELTHNDHKYDNMKIIARSP